MPNWLDINTRSGIPISLQLVEQFRHALEVGILRPGEHLPTVRQLAAELTIAPNTIVKAYAQLDALGLVESRPGVGTIVRARAGDALRAQREEALFERLRALVRDAASLGVGADALRERFAAELRRFYDEPARGAPGGGEEDA
jgi:GntR family transcriptional regulator